MVVILVIALSPLVTTPGASSTAEAQSGSWDGVPSITPNFAQDVETWWAQHPFNSDAPQYRPSIASPSPVVNAQTQFGGNIQAAIDALPPSGGTVNLPAGTYNTSFRLVARSNVHLVSDAGAVVRSSSSHPIVGCEQALDYSTFARDAVAREPWAYPCATDQRIRNVYIRGITFDGAGASLEAFLIRAARDIVFDNVTFQNFVDPGSGHVGLISGAAMLDNVWIRNSRFVGRARYALYLDGLHGGGVLSSRIEPNFGSGALLYLTNDDFSRDWNLNGTIEVNEQRMSQYVVAQGNTFAGGTYDVFGATSRNALVKNNVIESRVTNIASFESKSSYTEDDLTYQYFSNRVVGNTVQRTNYFAEFWAPPACPLTDNCARIGQYSIRDNQVIDPAGFVAPARSLNSTYGSVEGPNTVSGNCVANCTAPGTPSPMATPSSTPTLSPSMSSTPTRTSTPGPTQTPGGTPVTQRFPLGVFEDGNMIFGETPAFTTLLSDLASHNLDGVFFGNNSTSRDAPLLDLADQRGVGVVFAPHHEAYESWFVDSVPATLARAHQVFDPLVDQLRSHPSLLAYNLADEPSLNDQEKLRLAVQAVAERDPNHPSAPVLIAINTADALFAAARPGIFAADVYPIGADNGPCDFTMRGFGYTNEDFSSYLRRITSGKPTSTPLWVILQTHRFGPGGMYSLRTPSVAEVRAQHWMAIGEGATGIFWFIYSTQQDWTGLADNPTLFSEIGDLAGRTRPLRNTLLGLRRVSDVFAVTGGPSPYVSTLQGADGRRYAVVVNKGSCSANQQLSVSAAGHTGTLRDVSTGESFALGAPISFRPGDGRILELIPQAGTPSPTAATATASPTITAVTPTLTRTPTSVPATATTGPTDLVVTFDTRPNGPVNGELPAGEIDWGSGRWYANAPYGPLSTRSVGFSGPSITTATIQLLRPRALQRLQIYAEPGWAATVTLTCAGNPTSTVSVGSAQLITHSTGWTAPCTALTIASTGSWTTSFDTLEFGPAGDAGGATPTTAPTQPGTSTPTSAASTVTPTRTNTSTPAAATSTVTPTRTPTPGPTATPGASDLMVTFDTRPNGPLNGQFPPGEVDWGSNRWYANAPYGPLTTRSISFIGPTVSSGTLTMVRPRALQRVQLYAEPGRPSTVTLTCAGNPVSTVSLSGNQLLTHATGWTSPCASITVAATGGWTTSFDSFEFGPP